MPPKKGKKGKKPPLLIDGVDTSTMNRDQLEAFALRLKTEMEREREERNFFQMERDKIRLFWEITRTQLEEVRVELRQKDRDVEMAHELADSETKTILQQMKHLQYESNNKVSEIRAEAMTQLKVAQENHEQEELELLLDKRELRRILREKHEMHENIAQQLELKATDEKLENERRHQREVKDMERLHDEKMEAQKREIELIYRMQMFEVEERKNSQIQKLIESHDTAFTDMKNYYNDITLNNLGLIVSLKDQLEILRKQAERAERQANEMQVENRKLKEPLEQALAELTEMRQKMEHFQRDRQQLTRLKMRNTNAEKQMKSLHWETEALLLRNDALVKERESLKAKFENVVTELQQKTGLQSVLLERKLAQMEREGATREVMLREALKYCDTAGHGTDKLRAELHKRVADVIGEKDKFIQELQYEVARLAKAHDDLLFTYESKLVHFGIPKEELGFEPLRTTINVPFMCGPAGLVAKNK